MQPQTGLSTPRPFLGVLYGLFIGMVFGLALEKAKVVHPAVIQNQMLFTENIMLKVFLIGAGTSIVVTAVMEHLALIHRTSKAHSLGSGPIKSHAGNILGGLLLGSGITLTGSCPGTAIAQLGAGIEHAKYVVAGGVAAAFAFGYIHSFLVTITNGRFLAKVDTLFLDKYLRTSHLKLSLVLASVIFSFVFLLDSVVPWTSELAAQIKPAPTAPQWDLVSLLTAPAWSPILAGMVIGLIQIPSYIMIGHSIGASGAYVTVAGFIAKITDPKWKEHAPYFTHFFSFSDFGQLGTVIGIVLGAYVSRSMSGAQLLTSPYPTRPLLYFMGGFLLLIGARTAGGCSSGHGISGVGRLSVASLVTTASMFGGAIATAVAINALA